MRVDSRSEFKSLKTVNLREIIYFLILLSDYFTFWLGIGTSGSGLGREVLGRTADICLMWLQTDDLRQISTWIAFKSHFNGWISTARIDSTNPETPA